MSIDALRALSVPAPTDDTPSLSQADKLIIPAILELADRVSDLTALVTLSEGGGTAIRLKPLFQKLVDLIDDEAVAVVVDAEEEAA